MNARIAALGVAALALLMSWCASFVLYRAAERGDEVMQLEPRTFEGLQVVAVGTGTAYENTDRRGPSIGVGIQQHVWLVDAGRGLAEGLRQAKIATRQPSILFLTSLAPENTAGIDDLLMTGFLQGRTEPLQVIGPPGTVALAEAIEAATADGRRAWVEALEFPESGARLAATEVTDAYEIEIENITIRSGEISGGPLPALAWSFKRNARRIVISGTGWGTDSLIEFAQGADLLVHEAVFIPTAEDAKNADIELDIEPLDRERLLHTSINDVGEVAQRAGVAALGLVRLRPPPLYEFRFKSIVGQKFDGDVLIPADGDDLWP